MDDWFAENTTDVTEERKFAMLCWEAQEQWRAAWHEYMDPIRKPNEAGPDICVFNHPYMDGRFVIDTSYLRI